MTHTGTLHASARSVSHTVTHTGTCRASARPVAYTLRHAYLRAAGRREPRHPLLEGGDAVLDVRRVGEDDGGHDGGEVVGQVVALVEAAVLEAVPPALLVARAARTELNGGARAGGELTLPNFLLVFAPAIEFRLVIANCR